MKYEYLKWYEGTFQPKNVSTLKEGVIEFAGRKIRVQATDVMDEGEFKGQWRLQLDKMFCEQFCWIPEEDFKPN